MNCIRLESNPNKTSINKVGNPISSRPRFSGNKGFTFIELIIVLVIISIITLLATPKISLFFSGQRSSFAIITSLIVKTYDDAYINGKINIIIFHLNEADQSTTDYNDGIFARRNGISVSNLTSDGTFVDISNKLLEYRELPSSVKIEEIILSTGETIRQGNVMVPFYPNGYSDDVIIHVLVNGDTRWSIRNFKYKKEPRVLPDYVYF